jgi:hypothetical protein
MPPSPIAAARAAAQHVIENPYEIIRVARHALGFRLPIPLSSLRWLVTRVGGAKTPKDLQIDPVPPGVRFSATLDLMKTTVRASAVVYIEDIRINDEELRVEIRLSDVALRLVGDSETPVAVLLKSGALDLSKPGNFVKVMPKRPRAILDAHDDRIVLDFMNVKKLAGSEAVRKVLGVLSPAFGIRSIRSHEDDLVVALRASPLGLLGSAAALTALWRSRRGYR